MSRPTKASQRWQPRRHRRNYPYYKIQVFNEVLQSWKDERKVFESVEGAQEHITRNIAPRQARIMTIQREYRHPLEEED